MCLSPASITSSSAIFSSATCSAPRPMPSGILSCSSVYTRSIIRTHPHVHHPAQCFSASSRRCLESGEDCSACDALLIPEVPLHIFGILASTLGKSPWRREEAFTVLFEIISAAHIRLELHEMPLAFLVSWPQGSAAKWSTPLLISTISSAHVRLELHEVLLRYIGSLASVSAANRASAMLLWTISAAHV